MAKPEFGTWDGGSLAKVMIIAGHFQSSSFQHPTASPHINTATMSHNEGTFLFTSVSIFRPYRCFYYAN